MKRKLLFVLALLAALLCCCASAEQPAEPEVDLSAFSVDGLLQLRARIDDELELRGHQQESSVVYYDIERGGKGPEVLSIQQRLAELGYYDGKMTGKFDSETQRAFKQFEKAYGLENDGLASIADQQALFSAQAPVVVTPEPTPAPTPDPMAEIYAQYGELDYDDCLRHPGNHQGEMVAFRGKVVQVMGSRTNGFKLRVATAGSEDVVYVFVNEDPGYNFIEDDRVIVYAKMIGTVTYESTWKVEVTIPAATADYVVLR